MGSGNYSNDLLFFPNGVGLMLLNFVPSLEICCLRKCQLAEGFDIILARLC